MALKLRSQEANGGGVVRDNAECAEEGTAAEGKVAANPIAHEDSSSLRKDLADAEKQLSETVLDSEMMRLDDELGDLLSELGALDDDTDGKVKACSRNLTETRKKYNMMMSRYVRARDCEPGSRLAKKIPVEVLAKLKQGDNLFGTYLESKGDWCEVKRVHIITTKVMMSGVALKLKVGRCSTVDTWALLEL